MKQPRTSDFDPAASDRDAASSLKSPLTGFPDIEQPVSIRPTDQVASDPVPPVRPVRDVLGTSAATAANIGRRKIKSRHPFDIYEDQLEALKQLSVEDRMRGGPGSMSAMVRAAIDDYLTKARAK